MKETVPLIQRARMGDAAAFGVLVSRFQDMAYGYAYAILNDFHLAQDAAQEAFIEAYQCLPALQEAYAFPAWLKRKVHKHCDRLVRGKKLPAVSLEEAFEMASYLPGPAELAERRELARQVRSAIRMLPAHLRVVVTLFYIAGYSHQEIADFLELPAKTVKSRLHIARGRLRERMIDMVEDELKANSLPTEFTQETVEQAVARAVELNRERRYDAAEQLLRQVLSRVPTNPEALKEINRTLMHGRVYAQDRWDLLPELAAHGKAILKTIDDEHICSQLAETLMAIPAMPEADAFLQDWIARKGASMERLGMLAWVKGCLADYSTAEALWQELLALVQQAVPQEILGTIPFVTYTLVDCFATAGELSRAQNLAQQAWNLCRDLGVAPPQGGLAGDTIWMWIFHQAGLDLREVAATLLERYNAPADPQAQATALCIRNWVDDPQSVATEWLARVREWIEADAYSFLENYRHDILRGLRARGDWQAANRLARATWELLGQASSPETAQHRVYWSWELDNPMGAIEAGDWAAAEEIIRRKIKEFGIQESAFWVVRLAAARGVPTPPELVRIVEQNGAAGTEKYDFYDWYVVGREAAAAGNEARAFDALRKALTFWTNPPYSLDKLAEGDAYWGALRDHPEFKRILDEKRKRIGPIYGLLHYFPGW